MSEYRILGRCSLCGGDVRVFSGPWGGTEPPKPACKDCGAHPKNTLPVIPMESSKPRFRCNYDACDLQTDVAHWHE